MYDFTAVCDSTILETSAAYIRSMARYSLNCWVTTTLGAWPGLRSRKSLQSFPMRLSEVNILTGSHEIQEVHPNEFGAERLRRREGWKEVKNCTYCFVQHFTMSAFENRLPAAVVQILRSQLAVEIKYNARYGGAVSPERTFLAY